MRCSCGQENPLSASTCPRCGKSLILGTNPRRLAIDAAAAVGLLMALWVVFLIDRGQGSSGQGKTKLEAVVDDDSAELVARPLRLAVTPPEFDDVGRLLQDLGTGYSRYADVAMDDLLHTDRLAEHDVVFVTCGFVPDAWVGKRLGTGDRGGGISEARPEYTRRLRDSLREYVAGGGTLYASDYHFQLLYIAFEEFIDKSKIARGAVQTVKAEVVDAGLQKRLGPTIELHFDKRGWLPAAFEESKVTTYLRGTYRTTGRGEATGPLLVQFSYGDGNVIFTSFHNEKQNSDTEQELLRYLVFATVTAQTDAMVKRKMFRGGFSPVDRNLLSASAGDRSATETYDCRGGRDLQFVLGFAEQGAELRLTVVGPTGRRVEKTGRRTFTIDVDGAERGQWKYTVTPLEVPYENFPFTLTVGEKR